MSTAVLLWESLQHERRLFSADRLLLIVTLILLAAIGYALGDSHAWVARQNQAISTARAEEVARLQENRAALAAIQAGTQRAPSVFRDPANPLWVGKRLAATHAVLPPTALAATSIGQSDLNPPYVTVSSDGRETFAFNEEIENPANLLIGHFDLAFVVIFLLPLVVIALSYNVLSAEREQGTLALCLSNPIRLGTLLFGKLLFRAVLVLGLTVGITAAGLWMGGVPLAANSAPLLAWALLVVAYGCFWFALGAAVNVLGRDSAQNALILAGAWVVLLLMLPTLGSVAVNVAYPLPSRAEMVNTLRTVQTDAKRESDAMQTRYEQEHAQTSGAGAPAGGAAEQASRRMAVQQAAAARAASVMDRHDEQRLRQLNAVAGLRFMSPAILMQEALNDIAGTGEARYRHYQAQVDRFSGQWRDFFAPRVEKNTALIVDDYDRFPRFQYAEQSLGEWSTALPTALAGLLIPAALLGMFAAYRARSYAINS